MPPVAGTITRSSKRRRSRPMAAKRIRPYVGRPLDGLLPFAAGLDDDLAGEVGGGGE